MDILKLDLEKYKSWLWKLSEDLETYEIVKNIDGEVCVVDPLVLGKWIELYDRYLGYIPKRLGLNYFLPTQDEREEIDYLLENALEEDKKDFEVLCIASALPLEVLKNKRLSELTYHFREFYIEGEPIRMYKKDREEIFLKFFQDLYRFQFAKYLQGLEDSSQEKQRGNSWVKDESIVLEVLEKVGIIDNNGKMLIKESGSSIVNGIAIAFRESGFFKIGTPKKAAFSEVAIVVGYKGVMPKNPNEPQQIEKEFKDRTLEAIKVGNYGR